MIPFYFGASDRRLFGVYDAPSGRLSDKGAVICNPVGADYYYAHRACRTLARQLAGAGVHALRFDYLGTGDSARETEGVRVADWLENIDRAIDEIMEMADLKTVGLVGLRAGAALAATVAQRRPEVDRLTLWDPIPSDTRHSDRLDSDILSEGIVSELRELTDWKEGGLPSKTLLLCSRRDPELHRPLANHLSAELSEFQFTHHDEPGAWERGGDEFGSLPAPVRSLRTITAWSAHEL